RVAVAAERRIGRRIGGVASCVAVSQPVGALVPGLAAVGSGPNKVVPREIDKWRLPASSTVRGLVSRAGRGVIDGKPLAVRSWTAARAADEVLLVRRPGVRGSGDGDPLARQRPEVGEVLLTAAVERDV